MLYANGMPDDSGGIAVGAWVIPCAGDEEAPAEPTIRVAVLDFDSEKTGDRELGAKVATLVTAMLEPGAMPTNWSIARRSVRSSRRRLSDSRDRGSGDRRTHRLPAGRELPGYGARLWDRRRDVSRGQGDRRGDERVLAEMVSFDGSEKVSAGAMELAGKVHETIAGKASVLIAKPKPPADPVEYVNRALGDMERPSAAVIVIEQHVGQAVIDPAVPTELKKILLASGFRRCTSRTPHCSWTGRGDILGEAEAGRRRAHQGGRDLPRGGLQRVRHARR